MEPKYTDLFRQQCVSIALQRCPSTRQHTANELGVSKQLLEEWLDELGGDKLGEQLAEINRGVCPGTKAQFEKVEVLGLEVTKLTDEIYDARERIARLRQDNEIISERNRLNRGLKSYAQLLLHDNAALRSQLHEYLSIESDDDDT